MKILFPSNPDGTRKYYDVHYRYLLNVLKKVGSVGEAKGPELQENSFLIHIDKTVALIDFGDHPTVSRYLDKYPICFKYHYSKGIHEKYKNLFPIGPVSFHDWKEFHLHKKNLIYSCNNDIVLNNQRPGGNALERRKKVWSILREAYSCNVDTRWYPQQSAYWHLMNHCLVSVCVPGARNDMLDRGQFQYMALGCCTISPELVTSLAKGRYLKPGVHYLTCNPDYSNLVEIIEWCKKNRKKCVEIGTNAAKLFIQTSTPFMIWRWMIKCIRDVK